MLSGIARRVFQPLAHRTRSSAIEALRRAVARATVRTDCAREKCIETFPAIAATPEFAERRRGFAGRTHEVCPAGKFGDARQGTRLIQATPTIEEDEGRHDSQPDGLQQEREANQSRHADEADEARGQQTVRASENEPEQ